MVGPAESREGKSQLGEEFHSAIGIVGLGQNQPVNVAAPDHFAICIQIVSPPTGEQTA